MLTIQKTRHAELVSASMEHHGHMRRAAINAAPWALNQLQGDEMGEMILREGL